jgi:hypothetical protein
VPLPLALTRESVPATLPAPATAMPLPPLLVNVASATNSRAALAGAKLMPLLAKPRTTERCTISRRYCRHRCEPAQIDHVTGTGGNGQAGAAGRKHAAHRPSLAMVIALLMLTGP